MDDLLHISSREFTSRLLVGTGKYPSATLAKEAIEASGAEIITAAVRRINLAKTGVQNLQDLLPVNEYTYLPNSAGCYSAESAIRTLRLARVLSGDNLIKLEVIGDKNSLYPNMQETIQAAKILVAEDFEVMVYCNDDPVAAKELERIGCAAIMPLASPIGSGCGILNPLNIKIIIEQSQVPVIVDAGIGTASDAAIAMEMGADGVLLNTAIAKAGNPVKMAVAMKYAVQSGRLAYLSGRIKKQQFAAASSPKEGMIA